METTEYNLYDLLIGDDDISAIGDGSVTGAISSLSTSITNKVDTVYATSVAVSSALGFVSSPAIMFKRCGNTVICFLSNAQAKPTSTGWKTVCTVPSGYRNITGMEYMSIGQVNGTYFTQARYHDGNIEVHVSTTPSSNQYISFTGFWFTNDDYPSP